MTKSEDALELLAIIANSSGLNHKDAAEHMKLHPQRVRHFMEDLKDKGFLNKLVSSMGGSIWSLSKRGRTFLVKRNML